MSDEKIVIGMCVVLHKVKWSMGEHYQFSLNDQMHAAFPPAKPVNPETTPFVVMTAESYNLLQQAIDNTGYRDKLRNELLRLHGGILVAVNSNHVCRIDSPFPLNAVGKAWKEYAQALVKKEGVEEAKQKLQGLLSEDETIE